MTDHDHWDELAAGYALHALGPDDEELFVAHLENCAECGASLNDHELVAAQLGSISHFEVDDAPSWESIRASVIGASGPPQVVTLESRDRRMWSRRALAIAAAVVIIAGGGIASWQVASGGPGCAASSGCHRVQLDAGVRTLAKLVVRNDQVTVTPTDMPAAPTGKVYVLWQQPRNGPATPIGEFTAGTGGHPATSSLSAPYADTAAFAVSLESSAGPPPAMPSNTLASGTAT
jgi:anti-sigma-K factor RskA